MKVSVISFTKNGRERSVWVEKALQDCRDLQVALYTMCSACREGKAEDLVAFVEPPVGNWAQEQMRERNAMLFIGACGIAVRAIAPFLQDKLWDAPVLVMDEKGRHVIPILAGHMGGGNALALLLGEKIGAEPVITTATDIQKKFAVDLFAKRNGLSVTNREGIAKVSAKVLAGQKITMAIETGHLAAAGGGKGGRGIPEGIRLVSYPPANPVDVVVTSQEKAFDALLCLRPKEYAVGVGCRKGKTQEELGAFITQRLSGLGIGIGQVFALASISLKSREPGLLGWCQKTGVAFLAYDAGQLGRVSGSFTASSFVEAQVGVDNVCERAALLACKEGGVLVASKCAANGMTVAVAKREWKVDFGDE